MCHAGGGSGGFVAGLGGPSGRPMFATSSQYGKFPFTPTFQNSTHGPAPAGGGGMSRHTLSSHAPIVPEGLPLQSGQHVHGSSAATGTWPAGADFGLRFAVGFVVEFTDLATFVFGVFAMMRPVLVCVLALTSAACGPTNPNPAQVYDVGVYTLARDIQTAESYAGCMIRVRVERSKYTAAGSSVHVHGTVPDTPPLVIFVCVGAVPADAPRGLVLTGRCKGPTRDGVFRTARADFVVTVLDCSAVAAP